MIGSRHLCGTVRVVNIPGFQVPLRGYQVIAGRRQYLPTKVVAEILLEHLEEAMATPGGCRCIDSYPRSPWSTTEALL